MFKDRGFWVGRLSSIFVLFIVGGCGANAAQSPLSTAPAGTPVASSRELSEQASFVDHGTPNGVMIWLRVPAPGRDIPLLGTLLGLGTMIDPTEVLSHKLGATLSRTVDLSKPVDLTTSGLDDGPSRLVLAAGIFDADTFLSQVSRDFRIVRQGQGRFRLVPKAKLSPEALECELWHAPAPVGPRLLCATQPSLIAEQGEFLMAAARTRVDSANFHAEIPGSAAQALLRKGAEEETDKHRDSAASEDQSARAGRALGQQWVNDWGRDLSVLSWDLTLRRDSLELSQEIGLLHSDSVLSTALSGRTGAPKPVPDAFWQLPIDSDAALYFEGAEPEPVRRQGAAWVHGLRLAMESDEESDYPRAVLDLLENNLQNLTFRGGAFELAYGRDLDRAARALNEAADRVNERGPRSGSANALKKAQAELGGWALLGIHDDSTAYLAALRNALHFVADSGKYPRKKGAKPKRSSPSTLIVRELPLPPSAGLPANGLHFVVRSEPNAKPTASKSAPAASSEYHVIAAADAAQHSWFAISSEPALALSHLRAVLQSEPERTLGASADLRQLAKQPITGLGFGSLAAFSGLGLSADSKAKLLDSRNTLEQLWKLPKRGNTRMPIWITRAQTGTAQRRVAINLRLTPDAIGDVLALIIANSSDSASDDSE